LFFTFLIALPLSLESATTTDAINITITVEEAAVTPPPPPPPSGGGGPIGIPETVEIFDVEVIQGTSTATVSWKTNKPAISTFAWGTTTDYANGTSSEVGVSTEHFVFCGKSGSGHCVLLLY